MRIDANQIEEVNKNNLLAHDERYNFLSEVLSKEGKDVSSIIKKLEKFQVAIPSWALGAGGTRFGRLT